MNRSFFLAIVSVTLATVVGCASEDPVAGGDEQNVTELKQAAGFNFGGFVVEDLPAGREACGEDAVRVGVGAACEAAGGTTTSTGGCRAVCSVPIAEEGSVAGFDFRGFDIEAIASTPQMCPAVMDVVSPACEAAGGKATETDCSFRCSVPLAEEGSVAGYDFSGPRVLKQAGAIACPEVMTPEDIACDNVGGRTVTAAECTILCSKPIARL